MRRPELSPTAWSFAERLVPRVASALVSLTFAAIVGPEMYGYFSAALLLFLGIQAATDSAVRQIAVSAVRSAKGQRFIRLYQLYAGAAIFLVAIVAMGIFALTFMPPLVAVCLLPIPLSPLLTTWSTAALARMQVHGRWRTVALVQSVGTTCSCLVAWPLAFSGTPALAPSAQVFLSEMIFALAIVMMARSLSGSSLTFSSESNRDFGHQFSHAASYAMLSWLQGQSDRVLIGLIAGPAMLGVYSLALALSRNVSDALSIGLVNVLRPNVLDSHLDSHEQRGNLRGLIGGAMKKGSTAILGFTFLVCSVAFVGPLLLGEEWTEAFALAPILSVSGVPALVGWSLTPVLVRARRLHVGSVARVVGMLIGVLAALAAPISLALTAWIIVGREVTVAAIAAVATYRLLGWRIYLTPLICVLVGTLLALVTQVLIN